MPRWTLLTICYEDSANRQNGRQKAVSMPPIAMHMRTQSMRALRIVGVLAAFSATIAPLRAESANASADRSETVQPLPTPSPMMAIVSLADQRVTIYDSNGEISQASVSTGQPGHETPSGIFTVIQKEAEHYSNLYDDASMPFMQRITWSGIALHAGALPGHPASHGCVRMPYAFAEQLFALTRLGMRVVISRSRIVPQAIRHPALFQPVAMTEPPEGRSVTDSAPNLTASGAPAATGQALKRIAALKSAAEAAKAEADAAVHASDDAALMARRLAIVAARSTISNRSILGAKARAEDQLSTAESILATSDQPQLKQLAELSKQRAQTRLAQINAEIESDRADPGAKAAAAAHAAEQAQAAYDAKIAALVAARKLNRRMKPISVYISRQEQRLYVRQSFEPVMDVPIVIRDADKPIGTHLYTAIAYTTDTDAVQWTSLSMPSAHKRGVQSIDSAADARTALDRIDIPPSVRDRISDVVAPGSSLIISDEPLHAETSTGTDFIVIMSGELQGGILSRKRPVAAALR